MPFTCIVGSHSLAFIWYLASVIAVWRPTAHSAVCISLAHCAALSPSTVPAAGHRGSLERLHQGQKAAAGTGLQRYPHNIS